MFLVLLGFENNLSNYWSFMVNQYWANNDLMLSTERVCGMKQGRTCEGLLQKRLYKEINLEK